MKQTLLFLLGALPVMASAQTFSDDFESYTAGSKLAGSSATWATWTGAGGGTDDVAVINTKAHSGTKSVYFSSSQTSGGPSDVVLPFGGQYSTGNFSFTMWMFVESGKSAYFNFQEQSTVGKAWAMDVNLTTTGELNVTNTVSGSLLSTTYSQNQWFKIDVKIDLNTNTWEILLDDNSKGKFQNGYRQIASMDIYPVNGSGFYIDDVSYTYTAYTTTTLNGAVTFVGNVTGFLAGASVVPSIEIRNLGTTAVTSADLELVYDGNTQTKTVSGLNLAFKASTTVVLDNAIIIKPGNSQVVARVTKVNNATDDLSSDNEKIIDLNPLVPALDKLVIGEEATGTWCGWCPRGAVMLANLDKKYHGFFQGIAVHNNDPMMDFNYDRGVAPFISGYPSALVDRGTKIDPSAMETDFLKRIMAAPKATIKAGAVYDGSSATLKVSLTTKFKSSVTGNYKIACVLVEDGITGTTSGYNQSNYYSGGGSGVMGGFETLSNPVPASTMTYDHVARVISPGFGGMPNAFGTSRSAGDSVIHNFTFTVPADWNLENMHVVGLFIDPNGKIDNGGTATIDEAKSNGFITGQEVLAVRELAGPDAAWQVYPNPSKDKFTIESLGLEMMQYQVTDMSGKIIASGVLSPSQKVVLDGSNWTSGAYILQVTGTKSIANKILIRD